MRRPASSPPTGRAASPTSTPRSPSGWASTSRASRRATPRFRKSSPATAWRWSARSGPIRARTRDTVIDLDLANGRTARRCRCASCTASRATREGAPGPSRTIVLNRNLGEDASAELQRFRDPVHPLLQLDADGDRRRRPGGPHRADQRAVPVAVLLGGRPRRRRPPRAAGHGDSRARPRRLRRGARKGQAAAGRHRAARYRAARQ